MPKLTDYQRDALLMLRARLDPTHPGFSASEEVRKALAPDGIDNGVALYIRSWVLPLLDVVAGEDDWYREAVGRDAARVSRLCRNAEAAKIAANPHPTVGA